MKAYKKHCRGCGEIKILTYPKYGMYAKMFCTMKCAAEAAADIASASNDVFHCEFCGDIQCTSEHFELEE